MAKTTFLSYARADAEFAKRLASDLKAKQCSVWIDQIDILPGHRWDQSVEAALANASTVLVVLSPSSVQSENVQDEVGFAIDEGKSITPILHVDCKIPFRLRRWQYVDFRDDYEEALARLVARLAADDDGQGESLAAAGSALASRTASEAGEAVAAAPTAPTPRSPAAPALPRRFPVSPALALGGLVVVAIIAFVVFQARKPVTESGAAVHPPATSPGPSAAGTTSPVVASETKQQTSPLPTTSPGSGKAAQDETHPESVAIPAADPSTAVRALEGTLKKVKASGAITLGVSESSVPFSYLGNDQRPIGYSIDLCMKIVDAVKVELKMPNLNVLEQTVPSSTRIPLLVDGTIDLECGTTVNSADRQQLVSFTNTTFIASNRLVAKRSSGIVNLKNMRGKTLVSTAGTSNLQQVKQLNRERKLGINIVSAPDHAQAFHMVESGTADAFAMDDVLLYLLVASSPAPDTYQISPVALNYEPSAIMLRKDDMQFQALADRAIEATFRSGEINRIYAKWFLSPIPPRGLTVSMPMSDALKSAVAHPTHSSDPAAYR